MCPSDTQTQFHLPINTYKKHVRLSLRYKQSGGDLTLFGAEPSGQAYLPRHRVISVMVGRGEEITYKNFFSELLYGSLAIGISPFQFQTVGHTRDSLRVVRQCDPW